MQKNHSSYFHKAHGFEEPSILVCATCETQFSSAWCLCQHCEEEHQMNIYKVIKTEVSSF